MKQLSISKNAAAALRLGSLMLGLMLLLFTDFSLAAAPKVSAIAANVDSALGGVAKMMQSVGLVAGIGFILASFFKFHQHKLNPQQVPLSQGLTLLVIGAGLVLFPTLIPTATSVITGSTGNTAKLGGSQIKNLIGG